MHWVGKWMVVAAVVGMAALGCEVESDPDPAGPDPYEGLSLEDDGAAVRIDDSWKACETDSDCVLVGTDCNGCCGQDAIAASRQQEYGEATQQLCADYEGAVCDCAPEPSEARCSGGGVCYRLVVDGGW